MLEPVMFTGGLYKHDLVLELVEDLGGYILQKNVTQTEIILLLLVPSEDMTALEILSRDLRGELVRAPLAGTEVAVITPTLAIHHLYAASRRAMSLQCRTYCMGSYLRVAMMRQ